MASTADQSGLKRWLAELRRGRWRPDAAIRERRLLRLLGVSLVLCAGLVASCRVTPPPAPCPIEGLLIEFSLLRGDQWEETGSRSAEDAPARGAIQKIGTTFSTPAHGGITHHVYRFWHEADAAREYRRTTNGWFTRKEGQSEWVTPPDMADLQVRADQQRLGCSSWPGGVEECWFIARYGPYVVELNTSTLSVPHPELARLIEDIDRRMTACLAEKTGG